METYDASYHQERIMTLKREMVDTVGERDKIKSELETAKKSTTDLSSERDKLLGENKAMVWISYMMAALFQDFIYHMEPPHFHSSSLVSRRTGVCDMLVRLIP